MKKEIKEVLIVLVKGFLAISLFYLVLIGLGLAAIFNISTT